MLTREEFQIMQKQLVQMTDEKNSMKTEIATLKMNIQQIPQLKQELAERIRLKQSDEMTLLNEMSEVQQKIGQVRKEIQNLNDPNVQSTFDEKRLVKKEEKLQELQQEDKIYSQSIENYNKKLEQYQAKLTALSNLIDTEVQTINFRIRNYKKIKSFATIYMTVGDFESQAMTLSERLNKLQKKKQKRNQTIKNLLVNERNLKEQIQIYEDTLKDVENAVNESVRQLNSSEKVLELVKFEYQGVKNSLETVLAESSKIHSDEYTKVMTEIKEDKQKISENQNIIKNKQQDMDQAQIEHNILENKKVAMISQLQKVLTEKVSQISTKINTSSEVQDIVALQEKIWIDIEVARQEYLSVAKRHEAITKDVARKARILNEMSVFVKGLPSVNTGNPLDELTNIFNVATQENKRLAKEIGKLTDQTTKLEKEIAWLKSQL
ncbi:hypothetical protein TVAG_482260 [Trichomonas vaginalis G3]|uniref:Uncharacterized protein n=1 Tax=Trichomonas vaginalis (strain ATCC PRA-98 / G3) TaxID=412133 RepID=A2EBN5_TRIV3|nr:hypothetical protein TVAGG3_0588720 [Trichomonas vaginalis G3]EAY09952.1 hypothetical protein TVAG_482260 [Trichomonas vaginalis G3]KAI5523093.1 hypothetical protein TVAGG3_0588720 [Trichomonas vaginalis G3]|eukprot:XP_001322175.1 hypothetical protein [Trichomonas vaginalis G3]